ncbi:MAG: hypothetical protein V2A66_06700, partial [Pseudomonadota bacterium]
PHRKSRRFDEHRAVGAFARHFRIACSYHVMPPAAKSSIVLNLPLCAADLTTHPSCRYHFYYRQKLAKVAWFL